MGEFSLANLSMVRSHSKCIRHGNALLAHPARRASSGIPWASSEVLIIDTEGDVADLTSIKGFPSGGEKYAGGALAPNGKIYAAPYDSSAILMIDTATQAASVCAHVSCPSDPPTNDAFEP